MRSSADRLSQLGVDQFLKGLLHQVTEQEPDLVTAKLRDELSQSGIMALGHRVSPFESTADELAEDSTVAPSDHGSTYTTRWDAYEAGRISLVFRTWQSPRVRVGTRLRTP